MTQIANFIFDSFWHFAGTFVLLLIGGEIILRLLESVLKFTAIVIRGQPTVKQFINNMDKKEEKTIEGDILDKDVKKN